MSRKLISDVKMEGVVMVIVEGVISDVKVIVARNGKIFTALNATQGVGWLATCRLRF